MIFEKLLRYIFGFVSRSVYRIDDLPRGSAKDVKYALLVESTLSW